MKVVFLYLEIKDTRSIKNFIERKVGFVVNNQNDFEKVYKQSDYSFRC